LIDLNKSARTGFLALKLCVGKHSFLVTVDQYSVRKIVRCCVYVRCGTSYISTWRDRSSECGGIYQVAACYATPNMAD